LIPLRDANPTRRRPVVTIGLIAVCVAVFGYELVVQANDGDAGLGRLFLAYGLVPSLLTGQLGGGAADPGSAGLLTVFSSMFLHGDPLHIGFNMLYLWIFGNNIEDRFGHVGFLAFYLGGGIVAAAAQVLVDPTSTVPVIGASGAIAAVLGAYLVLFPGARVLTLIYFGLFFQLIHVPAIVLLGFWFAVQVFDSVVSLGASGSSGGVALFAHVGGFLAGVIVGFLLRRSGDGGRPRSLRPTDRFGVG
jgi:membrane associated rhomboid family serine protease